MRKSSAASGPPHWTKAKIMCRKTNLLTMCQQPMNPQCKEEEVLNGISYDGNSIWLWTSTLFWFAFTYLMLSLFYPLVGMFWDLSVLSTSKQGLKLRCCQLQRQVGLRLTSSIRKTKEYKNFEGYYCPIAILNTGAAVYSRTKIASLGDPGSSEVAATLYWNKWTTSWDLKTDQLIGSIVSDVVWPGELESAPQHNFSAIAIKPLKSFAKKTTPSSPFPKHKPVYPVLQKFTATEPDYAAYCNPVFLQHPALYAGGIDQNNPCYHTFNAEKPVTGMPKGITEQDFWDASGREHTRNYLFSSAQSSQKKLESWIQKEIAKTQDTCCRFSP